MKGMLGKKEVLQCVLRMFRAGFVKLQEVPKRTDHTPQSTFYLYTVDIKRLLTKISNDMHTCILNLRHKRMALMQDPLIDKQARRLLSPARCSIAACPTDALVVPASCAAARHSNASDWRA